MVATNANFKIKYGSEKTHNRLLDQRPEVNVVRSMMKYGTHESIHKRLVRHDYSDYRAAYAKATTNPDHVEQLAHDEHPSVREEVARRPELPEHIVTHLTKDPERSVRKSIANNPNFKGHHALIHVEHHHNDDWLMRNAARHPETHDKLVNHPEYSVRENVAYHTKNEEHVKTLMHDHELDVRARAAANPHMAHITHPHLMHDEHPYVRMAVAKHASPELAKTMMKDEDRSVSIAAYQRTMDHREKSPVHESNVINSFSQFISTKD